ncbi:ribonuclease H-like domain-containing protein [Tanacetum coccineum]
MLLAKASLEESTKWHRRMAHVNFKNMNKLAKHGLVKGLPSKLFTNKHNCVACNKGKQHKASYKAIIAVSTISAPLQITSHGPLCQAVSTACYVLNRVLLTKPHNKTPYELVSGKVPNISHLKPFGCLVTILNTSDHLGKFEGKPEEGFIVGYGAHTSRNRVPAGKIDSAAGVSYGPTEPSTPVVKPVHTDAPSLPPGHSLGSSEHSTRYPSPSDLANTMSSSSEIEDIHHHPNTGIFSSSSYDDDFGGTVTNLAPSIVVDSVPTKRVNTIHPQSQILGDLTSPVQTRGTLKKSKFGASAFVSYVC